MVVYYDSVKGCEDEIFLAATNKGLCFVSNNYEEMVQWLAKRSFYEIEYSPEKLQSYTEVFTEYFQGIPVDFSTISLDIVGTEFQQNVWKELMKIEFGQYCTYSDIAQAIGKPTAVRAVASAIGKNPILLVIPCHRVIGKNGKLTGFRSGIPLKEKLLNLEGINFNM